MNDRYLSVADICTYLGVKRDTVYKWISKKKLPAHRIGKLWKFEISEVDAWATGTGNIDVNPLFIGSGNYQIQSESLCINAGNPNELYNDTDGSRNDMGVYGGTEGFGVGVYNW